MKQVRNLCIGVVVVLLGGCISYPSTKILVTPIGAAGIHSFAPAERNPDEMRASREQRSAWRTWAGENNDPERQKER